MARRVVGYYEKNGETRPITARSGQHLPRHPSSTKRLPPPAKSFLIEGRMFHGTPSRNLPSILKTGLNPPTGGLKGASAGFPDQYGDDWMSGTSLTNSRRQAQFYALSSSMVQGVDVKKDSGAVLEIDQHQLKEQYISKRLENKGERRSNPEANEYDYPLAIPPKAIVAVWKFDDGRREWVRHPV